MCNLISHEISQENGKEKKIKLIMMHAKISKIIQVSHMACQKRFISFMLRQKIFLH